MGNPGINAMAKRFLPDRVVQSVRARLARKREQGRTDAHATTTAALQSIVEEMPWLSLAKYADPKTVSLPASPLFSQNFEDAVLSEIFHRIGQGRKRFIEIGASDGAQNTTRFLLEVMGWSGIWIEANPVECALARKEFARYCDSGRLKIIDSLVTVDNINTLVGEDKAFDLASVDVDQNTSHIWRALDVSARVACVEYNPFLPRQVDWEVDYAADGAWDRSRKFGASLKRLERIGRDKKMALVGCDFSGINAYFVSESEDLDLFQSPFTAEFHYEPYRNGITSRYAKKTRK